MRPRSLKPPLPSRPSWWLEEARAFRPAPVAHSLTGELEVDVAVVGGGYTGLWTALALRERDPSLRIALLEAREIGDGPSGRNGGFLHGYWSSLATLRSVLGDGAALQLAHASSRIVPAVRDFVEQRGEDVWLREGGLLKVSATAVEDAAVERSLRAARDLGVDEEAVAAEPRQRIGSPRFRRGVFFRDGATVQPARLALALKRAVRDAGVHLFEHTPVTVVESGRLETPAGAVRAAEIVLALNAWATGWPLGRRQTTFGSAVVLTEPVPELLEQIGWTGGEAVTDGRMFLHYFRTTPDGRVLMGSGSGRLEPGGRVGAGVLDDVPAQARAHKGLRRLLPSLANVRIDAGGAARSTSLPTGCRASAPFPARGSTTARATRATASGRAGSAARSSPRSRSERATNGRRCRSWNGARGGCRRSRSATRAGGSSVGGRSRRRRQSARAGDRQPPPAPPPQSPGSCGCRSASARCGRSRGRS